MPDENTSIQTISYTFAIGIIDLYHFLLKCREFDMARQVLRSGTSIGANVQEAQCAVSRNDFIYKIGIAAKEARETRFWLMLFRDTGIAENFNDLHQLIEMTDSIIRIISKIMITSRSRKNSEFN